MKAFLEICIYVSGIPERKQFVVYDGPMDAYDPSGRRPAGKETGYYYDWKDAPDYDEAKNGVFIWETCWFTEEEKEQLKKSGKMDSQAKWIL